MGLGREDITGVLPLYLFKEHWLIAKRRLQPVFGFMCTLDVMGYTPEQYYTIPFLVYIKMLQKLEDEPSKEVNTRMHAQILSTCMNILQFSEQFREETVQRIVDFALQANKISTRTMDVVKSVKVLAA